MTRVNEMSAGITLSKVHIRNVKSVKEATLEIGDRNFVFGPNDSGKSNLLFAIELALTGRRMAEGDIFKPSEGSDPAAYVDLMFVPKEGTRFDAEWVRGLGLPSTNQDGQFYAFRTMFTHDAETGSIRKRRRFITSWTDDAIAADGEVVTEDFMSLFECYSIDAHRDMSEDLDSRQSLWNRKVASLDASDELRGKYSSVASDMNKELIAGSELLNRLTRALREAPISEDLFIDPLPTDISDVYNGLDIKAEKEGGKLPISSLGLGSRSIAVLATARELSEGDGRTGPRYSLLMVEEPEAHLHPHLQYEIGELLKGSGAQTIVTTHSPYILSKVDVREMICCHYDRHSTEFRRCPALADKEYEAIGRDMARYQPTMIYARLVVFIEGQTEKLAFPVYFRGRFGASPESMGVSVVDVGGTEYKNFIRILDVFDIDWMVFSDGEEKALSKVSKSIEGRGSLAGLGSGSDPSVFWIPDGMNYERYVAGRLPDTVNEFLSRDEKRFKNSLLNKEREGITDETERLAAILESDKVGYAQPLAEFITSRGLLDSLPAISEFMDAIGRRFDR